ncbi:unnamed protein product [Lepeophtheirus salmonis]|uniref:(salmon louse) hypothetical protein n=1 Tax=Lepeophtheirus salmonis TaxID=72036 RepID=A0A7R8CQL7_LEPSM|nr:unnamed protein product [Lepeophtheirus salmonis]CAF2860267.1 unnamed protein product [Lepeophtheirus salmonis]
MVKHTSSTGSLMRMDSNPLPPHLPKEVPIPFPEIAEAVEAQIAFAAQEDAATGGSSFNGGFQGQSSGFQGQSSGFQGQSQWIPRTIQWILRTCTTKTLLLRTKYNLQLL